MIIVIAFQPLTIIAKRSILDDAAALDPPLLTPYLKMLAMISLIKQVLILILVTRTHACLRKARRIKESDTIEVISKLEY